MALVLSVGLAGACGAGDSGISPPHDRVFLPTALRVEADASARWLYVVNSNSDLRFNAGTVVALDLAAAAADRDVNWPACPSLRYLPTGKPERMCCRDNFDRNVLNCDERPYVVPDTTVEIGSFGSGMTSQSWTSRGGQKMERLFVGVRSDPSITFIDAASGLAKPELRCRGPRGPGTPLDRNPACSADWKVQDYQDDGSTYEFPQEPYSLTVDPMLNVLYVAHLRGGMSVLDLCAPEEPAAPRFGANTPLVFSGGPIGVTSVALVEEGKPDAPVYATSRASADLAELALDGSDRARCPRANPVEGAAAPSLSVKLIRRIPLPSFFPAGNDIRALIPDPARDRMFVLHRNSPASSNAVPDSVAAVSRLDARPDDQGRPTFQPSSVVEVGSEPLTMVMKPTGRGPRLFVVCFGAGQIWVVDPDRMWVEAVVDIGRGPSGIAFPPDVPGAPPEIAYVSGFSDNNVSVIDLKPGSATEYRVIQRIGFPRPSSKNGK